MSLGKTPQVDDLFRSTRALCEPKLDPSSLYRLLAERGGECFGDELFADLFQEIGRESVPPRIVATVMVLQRLEGASDREAVDRFAFDLRWKYAASVDLDFPSFNHTVLVRMRARLRKSERPDRIFEVVLDVAKEFGLVGKRRVLDSTALFDAVATQDTVTMIRSAIRAVLKCATKELEAEIRAQLQRDDDYRAPGKPSCDWDDEEAREALVDALARDGHAVVEMFQKREMDDKLAQAVKLLATVLGQDIVSEESASNSGSGGHNASGSGGHSASGSGGHNASGSDEAKGPFRIAEKVAKDRVISTVDPDARHGHKTSSRKFDGYKAHIAIDPDSEIITATAVTAGNVGDAAPAEELLHDILPTPTNDDATAVESQSAYPPCTGVEVYGDASYGTADLVEKLEAHGIEANVKVQPPAARKGMFSKDEFRIDLDNETVCCPATVLVPIRRGKDGYGQAQFRHACKTCELASQCTQSARGRNIRVHPKHETLDRARKRQRDPEWQSRYRSTRPKVERKFAHLMRRKHGGRHARVRGTDRVAYDLSMTAAAANLQRIATLLVPT